MRRFSIPSSYICTSNVLPLSSALKYLLSQVTAEDLMQGVSDGGTCHHQHRRSSDLLIASKDKMDQQY